MTREEEFQRQIVGAANAKTFEKDRDLGFGSVVAGASRQRLLNQDGTFNVQRMGLPFLSSVNLYHTPLSIDINKLSQTEEVRTER